MEVVERPHHRYKGGVCMHERGVWRGIVCDGCKELMTSVGERDLLVR